MFDLFTDEEIISKFNTMNIEEIANYFEHMDYSYVKRHKNGIFIEMAARGWSDNEYFLSLLTHSLSLHRREYIGYCNAAYWFVVDKKYKDYYRFEIVPFTKDELVMDVPNPNKVLYQEIYDCHDIKKFMIVMIVLIIAGANGRIRYYIMFIATWMSEQLKVKMVLKQKSFLRVVD